MQENQTLCGRLCLSKAGRDKGRYFIIMEANEKEGYALIVDGMMRKISKPKRKKVKHLELKPVVFEAIAEKFESGAKVFDAEIASAILGSGYVK